MELHIYGALYTALFVVLCIMFIGTFEEKRKYYFKWNQFFIFVSMIIVDYFISVVLDNNIVLKEVIIILAGTFFMYLYFQQKYIKTAVFVLSYQGICFPEHGSVLSEQQNFCGGCFYRSAYRRIQTGQDYGHDS